MSYGNKGFFYFDVDSKVMGGECKGACPTLNFLLIHGIIHGIC
jgi:hypothetical protein